MDSPIRGWGTPSLPLSSLFWQTIFCGRISRLHPSLRGAKDPLSCERCVSGSRLLCVFDHRLKARVPSIPLKVAAGLSAAAAFFPALATGRPPLRRQGCVRTSVGLFSTPQRSAASPPPSENAFEPIWSKESPGMGTRRVRGGDPK
ncbi:hypothetical protein CDAR_164921 [Caerostris darwini]|uniref:Uncharacterized protein n=1 Tax=Caerostris darwini TaxID=1538125 RepID=A0AAV4VWM3_9ARAC|nr:hypothetical protein CDAR_164921 [Caerostris darwini]